MVRQICGAFCCRPFLDVAQWPSSHAHKTFTVDGQCCATTPTIWSLLCHVGTESERPLSLTALLSSASSTSVASCSAGPQSQPSPSSLALEGGGDRSFLEGQRAHSPRTANPRARADMFPRMPPPVCGPASRLLVLGVPASELDAEQTRPDTHEEEAHASSGALSTWTAMASGSGALDLLSASHSGGKRNKAKGFDRSQHLGTYYVCTACGWSGSTRPRHDQRASVRAYADGWQRWTAARVEGSDICNAEGGCPWGRDRDIDMLGGAHRQR